MRTRKTVWLTQRTVALAILSAASACDSVDGFFGSGTLTSRTTLTSTTLSGGSASAASVPAPAVLSTAGGLEVTPDNVTGKVLSLLFATDGQEDEGIVVFGNERPDIAPADSDLHDFDFAAPEPITAAVSLKPGFVGGTSSLMVLLFGYMDMHMTLDGQEKVVRIALADVDDMRRGDKLLLDAATGTFRWYDTDTGSFTATRPANPAAIEAIRDFTDPIRPNLVFYPINAALLDPIAVDAEALAASSGMDVVLDFVMTNVILLKDQVDPSSVSDADLITSLDLTQNAAGHAESGFQVNATVDLVSGEESGSSVLLSL